MTTFSVGSGDNIRLHHEFEALGLLVAASMHTHSSTRAPDTESLEVGIHAARVPSMADIDFARDIGPSAQYIADRYGITYFTSPQEGPSASVMMSLTLPDLRGVPDAVIESIHYPAAVATIFDIQSRAWNEIDPAVTMHDLIPYSGYHTGEHITANVFAAYL